MSYRSRRKWCYETCSPGNDEPCGTNISPPPVSRSSSTTLAEHSATLVIRRGRAHLLVVAHKRRVRRFAFWLWQTLCAGSSGARCAKQAVSCNRRKVQPSSTSAHARWPQHGHRSWCMHRDRSRLKPLAVRTAARMQLTGGTRVLDGDGPARRSQPRILGCLATRFDTTSQHIRAQLSEAPSRTPVWGASRGPRIPAPRGHIAMSTCSPAKPGCKGDQECTAGIACCSMSASSVSPARATRAPTANSAAPSSPAFAAANKVPSARAANARQATTVRTA